MSLWRDGTLIGASVTRLFSFLTLGVFALAIAPSATAQTTLPWSGGRGPETAPRPGQTTHASAQRWEVGLVVTAVGGPCQDLVGFTAVPMEWPEQTVRVVAEDVSPGVRVGYREVAAGGRETGAREMVVRIARLAPGQTARAVITYEVVRRNEPLPTDTDRLTIPRGTALRALRPYLTPSPMIESTHPAIRRLATEVGADAESDWDRVEAIYDFVRKRIRFVDDQGETPLSAVAALERGTGDCDEMTYLFVALCRAAGIPARTVRVPGHVYPEFYLAGTGGAGRWFPCQVAGDRAFGAIPQKDIILQKGDNFRAVDASGRERPMSLLPTTLTAAPLRGGGVPQVEFILRPAEP